MNPVVHFEIPCDAGVRIARFHEQAFGWRTEALGATMGDCITAATAEINADRPVRPRTRPAAARR